MHKLTILEVDRLPSFEHGNVRIVGMQHPPCAGDMTALQVEVVQHSVEHAGIKRHADCRVQQQAMIMVSGAQ